jgi:hypothetical protein
VGRKAGVLEADNIREWRGSEVVDANVHKIGGLPAAEEEVIFQH